MLRLILFMANNAYAEPQFTKLEKGEEAPWAGRLFNDAAVAKFIVDDKYKIEQCNIQIEYEVAKNKASLELLNQKSLIDLQTKNTILTEKVSLRDDRIKELESLKTPPNPFWYALTGIVVGSGITIGIAHAVNVN